MNSVRAALLLAATTIPAWPVIAAETVASKEGPGANSVVAAAPGAEPARAISAEAAAKLSAAAPKFDPALAAKAPETSVDLRETDKPKNTIIRLPPYVVKEKEPPVIKEREVRTPKGKLDLALKKYPGLKLGSFWIFRNDGIALAMLEEEERLERKREMEDMAGLMRITDPAAAKNVKQEVDRAFARKKDFGR